MNDLLRLRIAILPVSYCWPEWGKTGMETVLDELAPIMHTVYDGLKEIMKIHFLLQ